MNKEEPERKTYESPEVEVVEIKAQQIVCVSNPNGTDSYGRENW